MIIILMLGAIFVYISSVHLCIYSFWSNDVTGSWLGGWNRGQQVAYPAFQELHAIREVGMMPTVFPWYLRRSEEIIPSSGKAGGRGFFGQRCFKDLSVDQVENLNLGVGRRAGSPALGCWPAPHHMAWFPSLLL